MAKPLEHVFFGGGLFYENITPSRLDKNKNNYEKLQILIFWASY